MACGEFQTGYDTIWKINMCSKADEMASLLNLALGPETKK